MTRLTMAALLAAFTAVAAPSLAEAEPARSPTGGALDRALDRLVAGARRAAGAVSGRIALDGLRRGATPAD